MKNAKMAQVDPKIILRNFFSVLDLPLKSTTTKCDFYKMWSKFPLNLQGCPPFFSIFAQQTKRTKHIVILGLWQKRLKITIVRLWNVMSAREFDWQFLTKVLKSSPINRIQKKWRQYLAAWAMGSNLFCITMVSSNRNLKITCTGLLW